MLTGANSSIKKISVNKIEPLKNLSYFQAASTAWFDPKITRKQTEKL